jgi:dimethylaniline monooxygenase (N-oxide forming)
VLSVEPLPENKWKVIVQVNGDKIEEHEYDAVAVCNGHHSDPYYPPNMTGRESFKGKLIHSHTYRTPGFASGKKVIVAGMGISGGDISEDIKVHGNALQIIRCTRRYDFP